MVDILTKGKKERGYLWGGVTNQFFHVCRIRGMPLSFLAGLEGEKDIELQCLDFWRKRSVQRNVVEEASNILGLN